MVYIMVNHLGCFQNAVDNGTIYHINLVNVQNSQKTPFQFAQGATVATSKTKKDEIHVVPRVDIDISKPWRLEDVKSSTRMSRNGSDRISGL